MSRPSNFGLTFHVLSILEVALDSFCLGMLSMETAVFGCKLLLVPVATEKVSLIQWKSTLRARSIRVNLNQGTENLNAVYFVIQARGNTRVCLQ